MTPLDRAKIYTSKVPPAISGQGGHDATYHLACELVCGFSLSETDAVDVLCDWNIGCQPPWSQGELLHKVHCAKNAQHKKNQGWRLNDNNPVHTFISPSNKRIITAKSDPLPTQDKQKNDSTSLPKPIVNATITLIQAAFLEGEGISMVPAIASKEGRSVPDGIGIVLTREEWLRKLGARDGDPNKIWSSEENLGGFIRLNPMKLGGGTDSDVTSYRHALLEFDTASLDEQWRIIESSNIPCTAVVYSGAKSLHAWVKVDAKDRVEYGVKVKELLEHFAQYSPDHKNKNPSRLARLAGMKRGSKTQHLLAINLGAKSWSAWKSALSSIGNSVMRVSGLLKVDTENDLNSMIGKRWLCKGHTCLIVGPSGVGKSTLTMQFAVSWAIGLPVFGVKPKKQLKSLIIQAENDEGDLSEQLRATLNSKPRWNTTEVVEQLDQNLVFIRESVTTGFPFVEKLQSLIDQHKPDLVWVDPLLSYIGDDLSEQKVASTFLRNWLAPVLESTGVILFLVHHIRKPNATDSAKSSLDLQYLAAGSSEVSNFSRAIIYIESTGDGVCNLHFSKRGKRAEAVDINGKQTILVPIKHSLNGPTWEHAEIESKPKVILKKKMTADDIIAIIGDRHLTYYELIDLITSSTGCSRTIATDYYTLVKDRLTADNSTHIKTYYFNL